jgi:hypothetical protein
MFYTLSFSPRTPGRDLERSAVATNELLGQSPERKSIALPNANPSLLAE